MTVQAAALLIVLSQVFLLSAVQAGSVQSGNMAPYSSGAKLENGKTIDPNSDSGNGQTLNDPIYQSCGQACIYGKANENISLQYQYMRKKMLFLRSSVDPPTSSGQIDEFERKRQALDDQKYEVLGSFCLVSDGEKERLDSCINRFGQMTDLWTSKVRIALATNEKSRGSLASEDGLKTVQKSGSEEDENKKVQLPFFSQSSDLGKFLPSTDPNKLNEKETLSSFEPRPEDFVMFDQIDRDPSDPSKGVFIVPKMKGGKHVLDDKAYQAAKAVWMGLKPSISAKFQEKQKLSQQVAADQAAFAKAFSDKVPKDARSVARKIYDDARGEYVTQVNAGGNTLQERAKNSYSPQQSFSGPQQGQSGNMGTGMPAQTPNVGANSRSTAGNVPSAEYVPGVYSGEEQTQTSQGETYVRHVASHLEFENVGLLTPEQQAQLAKGAQGQANPTQVQNAINPVTGLPATVGNPNDYAAPAQYGVPGSTVAPPNRYSGSAMSQEQLLNP